ncbi:MAG: BamA/TamA family outer membrane protein, partial [Bdellovibrionales bacterium]|nr:BamA/TamA family outer membrane protein [Bdellovibrionales bacterium]
TTSGIVWANNLSGGYLENLSNEVDGGVPSSRSFFLHGQAKMRGYGGSNRREHIPNIAQFNDLLADKVTGHSEYYMFKSEFRFPIQSMKTLAFAVFYDLGSLKFSDIDKQCTEYEDNVCKSTNPIRQSFGVGIHLNTPLGPIVFEYARKVDPRIEERADRVHLSIGSF